MSTKVPIPKPMREMFRKLRDRSELKKMDLKDKEIPRTLTVQVKLRRASWADFHNGHHDKTLRKGKLGFPYWVAGENGHLEMERLRADNQAHVRKFIQADRCFVLDHADDQFKLHAEDLINLIEQEQQVIQEGVSRMSNMGTKNQEKDG